MREVSLCEIEEICAGISAAGVCRAYLATMGGVTGVAIEVGLTEGVGIFAAGAAFAWGSGFGQALGDAVCP